ncbi:HD domain-containing protein [Candidatus Campbellbacteria bacterium]|jgi:putative hydrolase of HD superfamily|nr:MAG: HD domain-containing protein [Candidatus Campbellbacteria bacterium]
MKKKTTNKKDVYQRTVDFIYETNIHSQTPRSGFWFLGSGSQSVAEHLFHVAMIGYALAYFEPKANREKIVLMSLFHDIGEGRTSDHNYVHQRYGRLAEPEAVKDIANSVPFGAEIQELFEEEQARKTLEAQLVKDADQLEWMATLRGEEIKGNVKAKKWIAVTQKRLKTKAGKKLGRLLATTHPDSWWFDENDSWFVDRNKKDQKWSKK